MKRLFTLGLFFIMFTSCEHGGDFTYKVDNKSDYKFEVVFRIWDLSGDKIDTTLEILPHIDLNFYTVNTINHGCYDDGDRFLRWFDTISLNIKNDTMKLIKDFKNRDNWEFSSDCKNFGAQSEYLFTIENKDIEIKTK